MEKNNIPGDSRPQNEQIAKNIQKAFPGLTSTHQTIDRRHQEWKSPNIDQLSTALAKAQSEMKGAKKSSTGYKWKYADLHTVIESSLPYLYKYGLSIVQGSNKTSGTFYVTTTLLHASGQWMRSWIKIPVEKLNAQQIVTATTYGRRYGLAAMVGVSQYDDDGQENKKALEEAEKQS